MGQWRLLFAGVLLICNVTSCVQVGMAQAGQGLKTTLAQLPKSADLPVVASRSGAAYDDQHGMLYIAEAEIVIGTQLTKKEALAAYVQALQAQGWTICRDSHETEKKLVRGEHEWIIVNTNRPGTMLDANRDYERAKKTYPTLLGVFILYFLPSRQDYLGY